MAAESTFLASQLAAFPIAATLFGLDQLACLFTRPGLAGRADVSAALYVATQHLRLHLGDLPAAAFTVATAAVRVGLDLAVETMQMRPSGTGSVLAQSSTQVANALTALTGSAGVIELAQLRNNIAVFGWVRKVSAVLRLPATGTFALAPFVNAAYAAGDHPSLWLLEGLGHDHADRFFEQESIAGRSWRESLAGVQSSSLTMLHAGLGLALAQRALRDTTPFDSRRTLRATLHRFTLQCRSNSANGYEGAALESLGLVTRTWHPDLAVAIDDELQRIDREAREFFWHGVGRALYFYPPYFIPNLLSPWPAIDWESHDDLARLNLKAGLAWATTLVNSLQPEILEHTVRVHGARLLVDDAFTNGLLSSLRMRRDTTPLDRTIERLAAWAPRRLSDTQCEWWYRLIGRPCAEAIRYGHVCPDSPGDHFRFAQPSRQPCDRLAEDSGDAGLVSGPLNSQSIALAHVH